MMMEIEEAVGVLNRNAHDGFTTWVWVSWAPGVSVVAPMGKSHHLSCEDAIKVAEDYVAATAEAKKPSSSPPPAETSSIDRYVDVSQRLATAVIPSDDVFLPPGVLVGPRRAWVTEQDGCSGKPVGSGYPAIATVFVGGLVHIRELDANNNVKAEYTIGASRVLEIRWDA